MLVFQNKSRDVFDLRSEVTSPNECQTHGPPNVKTYIGKSKMIHIKKDQNVHPKEQSTPKMDQMLYLNSTLKRSFLSIFVSFSMCIKRNCRKFE